MANRVYQFVMSTLDFMSFYFDRFCFTISGQWILSLIFFGNNLHFLSVRNFISRNNNAKFIYLKNWWSLYLRLSKICSSCANNRYYRKLLSLENRRLKWNNLQHGTRTEKNTGRKNWKQQRPVWRRLDDSSDREGERRKRAFHHQKLMQGDRVALLLSRIPSSVPAAAGSPCSNRREGIRKNSDVKFSFPSRPTSSEEILPGRGEIRKNEGA